MSWWYELSQTGRELVMMFAMFFGVTFGVLTLAWTVDRAQQRRR